MLHGKCDARRVDVAIVGAGPAGCAAAITLAEHAPALEVCQIAPPAKDKPELGECVPPAISVVLRQLGLLDLFLCDGHRPTSRSLTSWGSPYLASNDAIFQIDRTGWRLNRRRFDAMMRFAAGKSTPTISAEVRTVELARDGLQIGLSEGATIGARFAIDATGRSAVLARAVGSRPQCLDRLIAISTRLAGETGGSRDLTIESDRFGWFYSNDLTDGGCVVVRLTDSDLARRHHLGRPAAFHAELGKTRYVARGMSPASGPPTFHPATSRRFVANPSLPILAVGDAAWTQDPISGEGIVKALRTGIYSAYAVGDAVARADRSGLHRYQRFMEVAWQTYQARLKQQYADEARWLKMPFWSRRQCLG